MQFGRVAARASLSARACIDMAMNAKPHSLRWATTGVPGDTEANDQARSAALADESTPSTSFTTSQAEYDTMPTNPDSDFGLISAHSVSKNAARVKTLRHPRRIEFYHRRHREIKKFEKKQDRIRNLREIAIEKGASGHHSVAQAAASEADRLETPWISRNVPVRPPLYASVSQGQGTTSKHAVHNELNQSTKSNLDLKLETKKLDVLNLKVGYAVDAQYALPDEVKAFILDQTTFCLYGVDKNQVTQIAANIRRIRPPEPYKGAGIRIVGETIKLKDRKVK